MFAIGVWCLLVISWLLERWLPTFVLRKVFHLASGLLLLLAPTPLTLWTKIIVALASVGIIWWTLLPRQVAEEGKRQPEAAKSRGIQRLVERVDLGILLFAVVINAAGWTKLEYKWLIPLFVGDPAAATAGALREAFLHVPKSPGVKQAVHEVHRRKSLIGSTVFFLSSLYGIYYHWVPSGLRNWTGFAAAILAAAISTVVELLTGKADNLALGVSSWIFSQLFGDIAGGSQLSLLSLLALQAVNVLGIRTFVH